MIEMDCQELTSLLGHVKVRKEFAVIIDIFFYLIIHDSTVQY